MINSPVHIPIVAGNDNNGHASIAKVDGNLKNLRLTRAGYGCHMATIWFEEVEPGRIGRCGKLYTALPYPLCPKSLPPKFKPIQARINAQRCAHLSVAKPFIAKPLSR